MIINFKKTDIYYAIKYTWIFDIIRILKIFLFYFLIFLPIFHFSLNINIDFKSLFLFPFSLFLSFYILDDFFHYGLKKSKIKNDINEVLKDPNKYNLAEFFHYSAAKVVCDSVSYAKKKKREKVDCSLLLYFCLRDNPELNFIFSRISISPKMVQKVLEEELKESKKGKFVGFTKNFKKTILMALEVNKNREDCRITVADLMAGLGEHSYILKTIITAKNIKPKDIKILSFWLDDIKTKIKKRKKWWEYDNLLKYGSLARDWATPYSLILDEYSISPIKFIKRKNTILDKVIGRDDEIKITQRILQKSEKNNVLLVGDLGSGRMKIINELTKIAFLGISLSNINYKKIVLLDLPLIISKAETNERIFTILTQIFTEVAYSGNIILIIKDIHNYVGQEKKPGIIDISAVLNEFLPLTNFRLIGITSFSGFRKFIFPNESFLAHFEKVEVQSLSINKTIEVLTNLTFFLEKEHNVFITFPVIKMTAEYADKYLGEGPLPAKAINLLKDVIHYAVFTKKTKIIRKKCVEEVIFEKTKILVGEAEVDETCVLLNLEKLISENLIGQKEAIKAVSTSLRRARAEITIKGGPIGSFLFLGPTGVGKTELSKVLARIYFGSEERMIRVDMSEYQNTIDVYRLIGSATEQGYLTTRILENPFSLVLLDEIEKAHPDILNLFLQILDEGYITDGVGRKINFKNTIIIATSNAGSKIILNYADKKIEQEKLKKKLLNHIFENAIFKPEFINRFDSVVLFHSLTKQNLLDISNLLLGSLQKNLHKKEIKFMVTENLKKKVAGLSYKPEFGAREMKRVIQDNIENKIAVSILNKSIKAGDRIRVNPETFRIEKL